MVKSDFIAASLGARKERRSHGSRSDFSFGLLASHRGWNTRVLKCQVPLPLVLKEEYPLYAFRSIGIGDPLDEKRALLIVKPDVPVDGLR
jgi:hypothetical protein